MDKKFDTLMRQWTMLQHLSPRKPRDSKELRNLLEEAGYQVDLRTVQRDLKNLSRVFAITSDESKPITWRWARDAAAFSVPGMDTTAALTLKMAGEFMGKLMPQNCLDSLSPHLKQAGAILDDLGGKGYGAWPDKIRVVSRMQQLLPPEVNPDVLEVVYEALLKDRQFRGSYRRKGENSCHDYTVNPLGLLVAEPVIYLVGTLWNYEDVLLLALHRFQSAELAEDPSRCPEGFSLDLYLEEGGMAFPVRGGKLIRLRVAFQARAAEHLEESPLSTDQKLVPQKDGRILLDAAVQDTQQLRWWLQGFGDQVEVLAPKKLREDFARASQNLAKMYQQDA